MAAYTLNILTPSVNNLTARVFVRALRHIGEYEPRGGGFGAWLFAIAFQLVAMGQFFDVAVRDFAMAIGALTLAQLTPFAMPREESVHP